jgi:hypothetical protein
MMTKKEARALLPRVGDVLRMTPTIVHLRGLVHDVPAQECKVVEVNRAHLWYRVKFKESGFTECYKVPKLKPKSQGGILDD